MVNAGMIELSSTDSPDVVRQYLINYLEQQKLALRQAFQQQTPIESLLTQYSHHIDTLLTTTWRYFFSDHTQRQHLSLVAVGGYGRQELHPLSDVDLLILSEMPLLESQKNTISQFIAFLWDLKLHVGHSVRSLAECLHDARNDLTIMTNLMEARLIDGNNTQLAQLKDTLFHADIWPIHHYYQAKVDEQRVRHQQYHDTSYNLQPDLKNNPGALRDIHTLQWMTLRYFGDYQFSSMVKNHFITTEEAQELQDCQHYLWRIRFALHLELKRPDNRLLFDRQSAVADHLGYVGEGNAPVEKMMKALFDVMQTIDELNTILLRVFKEKFIDVPHTPSITGHALTELFELNNQQIACRSPTLFFEQPAQLIHLFYLLAHQDANTQIATQTLRQLRAARKKYQGYLCDLAEARYYFMAILRHEKGIERALVPMHKINLLALYLPTWHNISGLMQFDLFHSYTVDEHTIRVLQNIAEFTKAENRERLLLCIDIYPTLPRPELLTIAGLFHDIAKGRHGHHAILGKKDVLDFAKLHNLRPKDCDMVVWLVEYHLMMSNTAQHRDIQDLDIIANFAQTIGTPLHLKYLLCLTVADICATNPTLWNHWRQSLLLELYFATETYWQYDIQAIPDQRVIARQHRLEAQSILQNQHIDMSKLLSLWRQCRADYFFRHSVTQLVWHAQQIINHGLNQSLVMMSEKNDRGGTEIFIYAPDRPFLFAAVSGELDARNLTILAAHISTNKKGMAMDTFIVLQPNGKTVSPDRHHEICQALLNVISHSDYQPRKNRRTTKFTNPFGAKSKIQFLPIVNNKRSHLQIITRDRAGLLASFGEVFARLNLSLHNAKISTVGGRVDDVFILTDHNNHPLDETLQIHLLNEMNALLNTPPIHNDLSEKINSTKNHLR